MILKALFQLYVGMFNLLLTVNRFTGKPEKIPINTDCYIHIMYRVGHKIIPK